MSPNKHTLLKNILSNWTNLFLNIVLSFILVPYVVFKLGDIYYGIWAVLLQFSGYLNLLDFGVRESVIRSTARSSARCLNQKINNIHTVSFSIYFTLFLICSAFSYALARFLPLFLHDVSPAVLSDAQIAVFLTGINIGASLIFSMYSGMLLGMQRFDLVNAVAIPTTIIRAFSIYLVLGEGHKIIGLAVTHLIFAITSGLITILICIYTFKKRGVILKFVKITKKRFFALAKRLFGFSAYVFTNNIGSRIAFASDAIVIAAFLPVSSVTYFAIAGSLIDYLRYLATVTVQVFSPLVSHQSALNEKANIRHSLLTSTTISQIICFPILITFCLVGDVFIELWMGSKYTSVTATVLLVLSMGQLFSPAHHAMVSILYGLGFPIIIAKYRVIEAITNIVLSIFLVNYIGLIGVALGTSIPHLILSTILLPISTFRAANVPVHLFYVRVLLKSSLVCIPFSLTLYSLKVLLMPNDWIDFIGIILTACFVHIIIFTIVYLRIDSLDNLKKSFNLFLYGSVN